MCLIGAGISLAAPLIVASFDRGAILGLAFVVALLDASQPVVLALAVVMAITMILERYWLRSVRVSWPALRRLSTRVVVIMLIAVLIEAVQRGTIQGLLPDTRPQTPTSLASDSLNPEHPDILALLLDGYARADVLAEWFQFDDRPMLRALESEGFSIARRSHSNYRSTNLSLPSFFNLSHLRDIPAMRPLLAGEDAEEGPAVTEAMADNPLLNILDEDGYETVGIASGYEAVALRAADEFIDTGQLNDFELHVLRTTGIGSIITRLDADALSAQARSRIDAVFTRMASEARAVSAMPRFVFAHVPSPHAPWVDGPNGEPKAWPTIDAFFADDPGVTGLTVPQSKRLYRDQVAYLNRKVIGLIDDLTARAPRPRVVLIFSDHGAPSSLTGPDPETRLRNLVATYSTGCLRPLPDDVTLVEVMPRLIHDCLGRAVTLPTRSLYNHGSGGPYDLVELPRT